MSTVLHAFAGLDKITIPGEEALLTVKIGVCTDCPDTPIHYTTTFSQGWDFDTLEEAQVRALALMTSVTVNHHVSWDDATSVIDD